MFCREELCCHQLVHQDFILWFPSLPITDRFRYVFGQTCLSLTGKMRKKCVCHTAKVFRVWNVDMQLSYNDGGYKYSPVLFSIHPMQFGFLHCNKKLKGNKWSCLNIFLFMLLITFCYFRAQIINFFGRGTHFYFFL